MVKPACPHSDQLASFVRCELSDEVAASVLDHLDDCPHCEETVAKLEHTIKSVLPGAAATMISMPYSDESACRRAVQSLVNEFTADAPEANPCIGAMPTAAPDSPSEFRTLRDFRIVEKVGQGGMGAVYKAVHQRMQRTVALKVLPSGMIGDQSAIARFNREMSVLGQLNHPNIVQAFDAGDHDGQHYLAMEFIEGEDLATVLRKHGRLSIPDACLVVCQVASALQYAHEKGFVHRDIKPSNLMLAEVVGANGKPQAIVKVLDLGLARVFEQATVEHDKPTAELTSAGQIMGTLDYMAPEQGTDSHQVDIRTDIYSLGATFYKLLTGDTPFAEHAAKPPMQRLMAMATLEVPPVSAKRPDIPAKLAAVVHRMLEKDPARRFQTPVELLRALEEFTTGANLLTLMRPAAATATDTEQFGASTKARPLPAASHHGGSRGLRRTLAMLGGFSAFVLLSAILVLTTRYGRIEVTSPDGTLPADLKVAVSNGGDSIEILQADNHWSAKVVNGEYQLQLTGGDDKFELKESKLTVSRMGKAVVVVELRKADALAAANSNLRPDVSDAGSKMSEAAAAPSDTKSVPSLPPDDAAEDNVAADNVAAKANPEKPFALLGAGGVRREFRTMPGALAELKTGDTVEISGHGPYLMPSVPFNHLNVTVRAAEGSRPELVFNGGASHNAGLQLHGLDLIFREAREGGVGYLNSSTDDSNWVISKCRIQVSSLILSPRTKLQVSDSLLLVGIFALGGGGTTAVFDNNVIVSNYYGVFDFGYAEQWADDVHLTLTNNTILVAAGGVGGSRLFLFGNSGPQPGRKFHVTARNNLFALDGGPAHGHLVIHPELEPKNPDSIDWQGEGNLFCPFPLPGKTTKDVDGNDVIEHPLDAWARWLKRDERESGSQIAAWPHWQLAAARWVEDATAIETLQQQIESSIPPELRQETGPNWELLGAGDAYVRALVASGRAISESDLRPEAIGGGSCVIIRNGMDHDGFPTLQAAIDASVDKDIVEIRTDRNVGRVYNADNQRQLTIRAGAGYSPEVETIQGSRLNLEGLRFARGEGVYGTDDFPEVPREQIVRITNCVFPASEQNVGNGIGSVSVYHESGKNGVAVIFRNCWIEGAVELNRHPGQPIRFENCVVPRIRFGVHSDESTVPNEAGAAQVVQFDRCAVWSPELRHGRTDLISTIPGQSFHIEVVADRTLFETRGAIREDGFVSLSGRKNLFRIGNPHWFVTPGEGEAKLYVSCLADVQQRATAVTASFEGHPQAWDPSQWQLLPSSPGFQAGPGGKDTGADIDHLSEVLNPRNTSGNFPHKDQQP